jgi:hypothetical protein
MRSVRLAVLLSLVLLAAAGPAFAAPRPRLVTDEYTNGIVVGQRWFAYWRWASPRLSVLDTKTLRRTSYRLPEGCHLFNADVASELQVQCRRSPALVDVRTGRVTRLPRPDPVQDFSWSAVGRRWLWFGMNEYQSRTTGKRVTRRTKDTRSGWVHRNLDDPKLRPYRLCAPHGRELDWSADQQWRGHVVFRDAEGRLRAGRCGSARTTVLGTPRADPDLSLAGGVTVWGDGRNCTRHVNAYVARTGRRVHWPLGRVNGETCSRSVVHTRYAILAPLWWGERKSPNDDGSQYRTYRLMRLPLPH